MANNVSNSSNSTVYGPGLIGSAIYIISTASGFWMGLLGFLKPIVWPAFMAYELFNYLGDLCYFEFRYKEFLK